MSRKVCVLLIICFILASLTGCSANTSIKNYEVNKDKIDDTVIDGSTEFAFDIFRELNEVDENIFISPLSISSALTMTYQGANGTTRTGMAKALNYTDIESQTINESYKNLLRYLDNADDDIELNINNSIWIRKGKKIEKDFIKTNKDIFNAYVTELDFSKDSSANKINKWIDKSTNGKIKKMIDSTSPDIIMYLINAIYFKGQWTDKFKKESTFESKFNLENGETEDIMMMSREDKAYYGEGKDFKVVKLYYGNKKTAMYFMLPKKDMSIRSFINSMDASKWEEIQNSISREDDVILQIPRFKMDYGIKSLNGSLSKLGMGEAFTPSADFTGISNNVFIDDVLHKAVIEVNEEGSEAAGVTVVKKGETCILDEDKKKQLRFIADRPFLLIIVDGEFDTILFMGKIYNIK